MRCLAEIGGIAVLAVAMLGWIFLRKGIVTTIKREARHFYDAVFKYLPTKLLDKIIHSNVKWKARIKLLRNKNL